MYQVEKHYIEGYIILPCFTVRTLEGTESADMTCSPLLQKIFEIFFAPFWTGKIVVTGEHT